MYHIIIIIIITTVTTSIVNLVTFLLIYCIEKATWINIQYFDIFFGAIGYKSHRNNARSSLNCSDFRWKVRDLWRS